jgi:hypothetical protein
MQEADEIKAPLAYYGGRTVLAFRRSTGH